MNELVTGEAVVLDLRPAELVSRGLAFALDLLVMVVVFVALLTTVLYAGTGFDTALGAAVILAIVAGVFVVYPVTLETLTRGRSIGKLALGLRVVGPTAAPSGSGTRWRAASPGSSSTSAWSACSPVRSRCSRR